MGKLFRHQHLGDGVDSNWRAIIQSPSNESSDNVVAHGHGAVNHPSDVYPIFRMTHDFSCHSVSRMPNLSLAKDSRRQIFAQYMTLENKILVSFGNRSICECFVTTPTVYYFFKFFVVLLVLLLVL